MDRNTDRIRKAIESGMSDWPDAAATDCAMKDCRGVDMGIGYQPGLFEHPPSERKPPAGRHSDQSPVGCQTHDQRLRELDLRYGATNVYRVLGQLYAWGDFTHCPREDIEHNIRRLTAMIREEPGLTYIGKPYASEILRSREKVDWPRVVAQVRRNYQEPVLIIDNRGQVLGVSIRGEPLR